MPGVDDFGGLIPHDGDFIGELVTEIPLQTNNLSDGPGEHVLHGVTLLLTIMVTGRVFLHALPSSKTASVERNWDSLMAAAQGGDGPSYQRLLLEIKVWLERYYRRRLPPAMIDDAVQEALIAIHQKRHTYDPSRPFVAWLSAVARYKWIDTLRSLKAHPLEELGDSIATEDHETSATSGWYLERLMEKLKPAQAEAIRLVKLQGFSTEEAAAITGQSTALVKVNVHRGLRRLTSLLRSEPDEE